MPFEDGIVFRSSSGTLRYYSSNSVLDSFEGTVRKLIRTGIILFAVCKSRLYSVGSIVFVAV